MFNGVPSIAPFGGCAQRCAEIHGLVRLGRARARGYYQPPLTGLKENPPARLFHYDPNGT